MSKSVIVTGNLGYLGPLVVRKLRKEGYVVLGVDPGLFPAKIPFECVADVQVASVDQIPRAFWEPKAVVHLAAISNDPMGELNATLTYRTNVNLVAEVADMFSSAKQVLASSASVYGWSENNCVETDPIDPLSVYADSKVKAERVLQMITPNAAVLRFATLWGSAPNFRTDLVVNRFFIQAIKDGTIKPLSNAKRPLLHVSDAADAIARVVAEPDKYGGVYNVNGENTTVFDIASKVGAFANVPVVLDESVKDADNRSYHIGTFEVDHLMPLQPITVGDEQAMNLLSFSASAYKDMPTRLEAIKVLFDIEDGKE
jgi:nucleoside-diphosphate-sugar epimerase